MIRYATKEDVDFIYRLGKENLQTSFTAEALDNYVEEKQTMHVFVIEDKSPVGYIIVWESDYQAEIIDVVIEKNNRSKGYGRKLIVYVIDFLLNKGVKTLSLEVSVLNINAIKLYEELGFKKEKTLKNYYKDSDGFLYIKQL